MALLNLTVGKGYYWKPQLEMAQRVDTRGREEGADQDTVAFGPPSVPGGSGKIQG